MEDYLYATTIEGEFTLNHEGRDYEVIYGRQRKREWFAILNDGVCGILGNEYGFNFNNVRYNAKIIADAIGDLNVGIRIARIIQELESKKWMAINKKIIENDKKLKEREKNDK